MKTAFKLVCDSALLLLTASLLCATSTAGAQGTAKQQASTPRAQTTSPVLQPDKMPVAPGAPVDRVVAIVNGDLVLDSDVDEERRFETIQPYRGTNTADTYTREAAMERLVSRTLILQQAQLIPGNDIDDEDVDKEITELRAQIPACRAQDCGTDVGWTRYLKAHGFTPAEFRARWKQRMQVLAFIEERFRQGIKIEPEEIKSFYEKTMLPEYARQKSKAPPLDQISDRIEEVLLEQQVSALLRDWLKSLRAQGSVVVMHPGEEAP